MTGPEFKTLREAYGLTAQAIADLSGYALRTVQHWEAAKGPVAEDAAETLRCIIERVDTHVDRMTRVWSVYSAGGKNPVVLSRFAEDEDLWCEEPGWKPLPASCHAHALARVLLALRRRGAVVAVRYAHTD